MDSRIFPGGGSQATLLPAVALTELGQFAKNSDEIILNALLMQAGDLKCYANSGTVTAQSVPAMAVNIAAFPAFQHTPALHGLGFNTNCTGQTGITVTGDGMAASAVATVPAASASNPRRDLICWQIQSVDMNYAGNNTSTISLKAVNTSDGSQAVPTIFTPNTIRRVALQYVQGSAAASPALPTVPAGWYPLAEIYVGANVTTITSGNIFNAVPAVNRPFSLRKRSTEAHQGLAMSLGSGLSLFVMGGLFQSGDTQLTPSDTTVTLANNATNYVFVNGSSGVITSNTTGFPSGSVPLSQVVTSSGNITSVTDKRAFFSVGSGGGTTGYGKNFLDGLEFAYVGPSSVSIATGSCRSSDNTFDINVNSTISSVSIGSAGIPNGLDTGTVASGTTYFLHVIADSTNVNSPAGLWSLSATSPTLPSGYNKFKMIGALKTNGSSQFPAFNMHGKGRLRTVIFQDGISVLSNAFNASFTPFSVASAIPVTLTQLVILNPYWNSGNANSAGIIRLRTTGSGATNGTWRGDAYSTSGGDTSGGAQVEMFCDNTGSIDYQQTNGVAFLSVLVNGFRYEV